MLKFLGGQLKQFFNLVVVGYEVRR